MWRQRAFYGSGIVDDFTIEQRHETFRIFDLGRWDRVEIAVPDGQVRILPDLDRTDLFLEEHLSGRPDGNCTQGDVHVHRLRAAERVLPIDAEQRFARDSGS